MGCLLFVFVCGSSFIVGCVLLLFMVCCSLLFVFASCLLCVVSCLSCVVVRCSSLLFGVASRLWVVGCRLFGCWLSVDVCGFVLVVWCALVVLCLRVSLFVVRCVLLFVVVCCC